MSTPSFEIVVAIRPPWQDISTPQTEYWLETSSGALVPLDLDQFTRASRAYQSGHRRFKLGWSQDGRSSPWSRPTPAGVRRCRALPIR
jgi:hypothetical protein